jgi:hypothetical protein
VLLIQIIFQVLESSRSQKSLRKNAVTQSSTQDEEALMTSQSSLNTTDAKKKLAATMKNKNSTNQ